MAGPKLHITVTTLSTPGGFSDITHEMRLVKAALLYADHVTLYSPKISLVLSVAGVIAAPIDARWLALTELLGRQPELRQSIEEWRKRRQIDPDELWSSAELLLQINSDILARELKQLEKEMFTTIEKLKLNRSYHDLTRAMAERVLDIYPYDPHRYSAFSHKALFDAATKLLTNVIGPSANSYPLFDDSAGKIVNRISQGEPFTRIRTQTATQAGLASRYIEQLEAFPAADMATVLDARKRLMSPLIRFRAAIGSMANELSSTPLDSEFAIAADDLYRRDVAPALLELNELAEDRRLLRALRRQATGTHGAAVTKAGLALAATTIAGLPDIAKVAAPAIVAAAEVTSSTVVARREAAEKMRANKFLWLYEAPKALIRR